MEPHASSQDALSELLINLILIDEAGKNTKPSYDHDPVRRLESSRALRKWASVPHENFYDPVRKIDTSHGMRKCNSNPCLSSLTSLENTVYMPGQTSAHENTVHMPGQTSAYAMPPPTRFKRRNRPTLERTLSHDVQAVDRTPPE